MGIEGWDVEEGYRVGQVEVVCDGRVVSGAGWLAGLELLGQDWVSGEDVLVLDGHHGVLPGLESLLVSVDDLVVDPGNARRHSSKNLRMVARSLDRFGQHQPLVVQKSGMLLRVGHARLECAKGMGWTHVAALVVDESDVESVARAIADNRAGELGEWDYANLGSSFAFLDSSGVYDQGFFEFESLPQMVGEGDYADRLSDSFEGVVAGSKDESKDESEVTPSGSVSSLPEEFESRVCPACGSLISGDLGDAGSS